MEQQEALIGTQFEKHCTRVEINFLYNKLISTKVSRFFNHHLMQLQKKTLLHLFYCKLLATEIENWNLKKLQPINHNFHISSLQ